MIQSRRSLILWLLVSLTAPISWAAISPAVGEPGGKLRTDDYPSAGFGFFVPEGAVTKINQLGYWDHGLDGLQSEHTVTLYQYAGSGSNYIRLAGATIPAGTGATLSAGYRWVHIPELSLESVGVNGNYYVILASHGGGDPWTDGLGAGAPMRSSMGILSFGALNLSGNGPQFQIAANRTLLYGGPNLGFGEASDPATEKTADFISPPARFRPKPLWFWNNTTVTAEGIAWQMQNARDLDGYSGFGILPFGGAFRPEYLTDAYFDVYGAAVDTARELGMSLYIYDEYGFPSGSAGAINGDGVRRFANAHPDDTIKRLDKFEADITGPSRYQRTIPSGKLMACVAMENNTRELVDLTHLAATGALDWDAPAGSWKVMVFVMVADGDPNVDYLDPDACAKFVQMTYQQYYDRFGADFGKDKTITGAFFDEPTMYRAGGRIWTGAFNDKFEAKYGFRPEIYYPALWYDIGPDTQAARNHLFGFRSELYATGFSKTVQDWCREHGDIPVTGHQDQEEVVNPTNVTGDLMKIMREQDIPGIDLVGARFPSRFYKIVGSAARNYDQTFVMSETYGAMGNIGYDTVYREAMDQYSKGINMLIPHAVWYDDTNVRYLPELSWRNPLYAAGLPAFNRFIGRLNVMLQQEGRHVADIGMLYPIATLQGGNHLDGPLGYHQGGVAIPEADYTQVGALLSDAICRDFTFIHPEILDEKCVVDGKAIRLENAMNPERYQVFILPGQTTISWSNLQKIKQFYDNGGKVIATRRLPHKSAEFGHDEDVQRTVAEMFAPADPYPFTTASSVWLPGGYEPDAATDGSVDTRWNAASGTSGGEWLQVDFGEPVPLDRVTIREALDRITSYTIQYWDGAGWVRCAGGTTIGTEKSHAFDEVVASKVRLHVDSISGDSASIYEFNVRRGDGPNLVTSGPAAVRENANGGKTYFIASHANVANLRAALDDALAVPDVRIENDRKLQHLHKVSDGRHFYYFANLGGEAVDTWVRLRGAIVPQIWDPHTGTIDEHPEFMQVTESGQTVTRVRLHLAYLHSAFVVDASFPASLPELEISRLGDEITLTVRKLVPDGRYRLMKSPDLSEWRHLSDFTAPSPPAAIPAPDGSVEVTFSDNIDDWRAFYRVEAVEE